MTVSKVPTTQTTQTPADASKCECKTLKPVPRINVAEGMKVASLEANGSEAQKIAARAFDSFDGDGLYVQGGDGYYNAEEAADMNNYRFAYDPVNKEFRAHNQKTGCSVILKYDNEEQLRENISLITDAGEFQDGTITYNLNNRTLVYDGVTGDSAEIRNGQDLFDSVTFTSSSVKKINAPFFTGNLKLDYCLGDTNFFGGEDPIKVIVQKGQEPVIKSESSNYKIVKVDQNLNEI